MMIFFLIFLSQDLKGHLLISLFFLDWKKNHLLYADDWFLEIVPLVASWYELLFKLTLHMII